MKSNLKFLTEIALFYPIILQGISSVSQGADRYELIFQWGIVIFALIISYLLVDKFIDVASDWAKRLMNIFIIMSLVSFAIQFYLLALTQSVDIKSYHFTLMGLSVLSMVIFPIVILALSAGYLSVRYLWASFK